MIPETDKHIVRELAAKTAEIAALNIQEEKRALWRKLNTLRPERPMVMIDQVCWSEIGAESELQLRCEDAECRSYEQRLRRTLFQWKHFPVDMVVEPFIQVPKAVKTGLFGLPRIETTLKLEQDASVSSHRYENQFLTEDDLEKIRMPRVSHDEAETARRIEVATELFGGLLEVRPAGFNPAYLSLWDPISQWMGVEGALEALIDRPDYMHRMLGRMVRGIGDMLDQLEEQGLLRGPQELIHCTGAHTDELPAAGYDPRKPRTKDLWAFAMAQMFQTVSPRYFKEFEVDYMSPLCERFGLIYYGCCEPLDDRIDLVRTIPRVRKISVSPWANEEKSAEGIGPDFVYSRKPNPALLAWDSFHPDNARDELLRTLEICERHGCPLEFILKDISTVRDRPERLTRWADAAMDVVLGDA